MNKPVFDVSSAAAWRGLILPSCKSWALTLLTKQLSQQPQRPGQEAALLCEAPLRTAGACVWGPLSMGHSAASTTDRLFPAKWYQQKREAQRGDAAEKSLQNVGSLLQNGCLQESASSGQVC